MIKKLLIIAMAIMSFAMMSCGFDADEAYTHMDELETPEEIKVYTSGLKNYDVVATHKTELNEDETLYYIPEVVKTDGKTYLNDINGYYVFDSGKMYVEMAWTELDDEALEKIFGDD